jgi:hypothetical protein
MNETRERRTMERQSCNAEVDLSYFNTKSHWSGSLLNISQEGGYLETTRSITPSAAVQIRVLSSISSAQELARGLCTNAVAEVKWCRNLSGSEKARYGVGVRYYFPLLTCTQWALLPSPQVQSE